MPLTDIFGVEHELQVSGSDFYVAVIRNWAQFYTLATQPRAKWEPQSLHHSWLRMCRCGSMCRAVLQAYNSCRVGSAFARQKFVHESTTPRAILRTLNG